jgi:hypothetical protein
MKKKETLALMHITALIRSQFNSHSSISLHSLVFQISLFSSTNGNLNEERKEWVRNLKKEKEKKTKKREPLPFRKEPQRPKPKKKEKRQISKRERKWQKKR